jgi:hypothetical protein
MKRFFIRKSLKNLGTGCIKDPRTQEEKQEDYRSEEVLASAPVVWREKPRSEWRKFPIFHQSNSSSCVGMTYAKLLGVENFLEEGKWVDFSARDIYSQRMNKPNLGMWSQDAANICYKKGATLEQLMPSQKLGEADMNNDTDRKEIDRQVALVGKAGGYLSLPFSFDGIANILRTGKAVALVAWFNPGDWRTGEVITRTHGQYGHLVAAVDYTLYKGKRAIVFDNSWDYSWGFDGQGVLVEGNEAGVRDYCVYLKDLNNNWRGGIEIEKPKFVFTKNLEFGMRNNDIVALQKALKYFECFPQDSDATGYYGNITAKAILKWQLEYKVDTKEVLDSLGGRVFGPKSRSSMSQLLN